MYTPRQIVAYGTLTVFLVLFTLNTISSSIFHPKTCSIQDIISAETPVLRFTTGHPRPGLDSYELVYTLEAGEFPLDDETKRLIIVGDLHGMSHSLQALLNQIEYSPSQDILVHVGDIMAKGPHKGSLEIVDFMTQHNTLGVRGNHDQTVIEWRAWIEWVQGMPGGSEWLLKVDKQWKAAHKANKNLDPEDWTEHQRHSCRRDERRWWNLVPKHWIVKGDHYRIAQDLTPAQYKYLLDLPIRLYIPSAHMFVMHAGMLSFDPRYEDTDKRQPLAHPPDMRKKTSDVTWTYQYRRGDRATRNHLNDPTDIDKLRNIQEVGLLTEIPQNKDLWDALNMRTVNKEGKVSNKPDKGKYWTKIWKKEMNKCAGFNAEDLSEMGLAGSNITWPDIDDWKRGEKGLPCYPSTAVYGHTASRGLEVKRWTVGLDSGCMYGRSLTALIVGGTKREIGLGSHRPQPINLHRGDYTDQDAYLQQEQEAERVSYAKPFPFGDRARATAVSLKCKLS